MKTLATGKKAARTGKRRAAGKMATLAKKQSAASRRIKATQPRSIFVQFRLTALGCNSNETLVSVFALAAALLMGPSVARRDRGALSKKAVTSPLRPRKSTA